MNREQSIELFNKCEAARREALAAGKNQEEAHEAAKAIWNGWANDLLDEKKQYEDQGMWEENQADWLEKASITFTQCDFQLVKSEKITFDESDDNDKQENVRTISCEGEVINLSGYIFPSTAIFRSATFSRNALFRSATFSDTADFVSATFSGTAYFEIATFSRNALFRSAAFSDTALFQSATFSRYANFLSATFSRNADFWSATFSGTAIFRSAIFSRYANFLSATFSGYADFQAVTFSGAAIFRSATFSGTADFQAATFSSDVQFNNCDFEGSTEFEKSIFEKNADFTALHSKRAFDLSEARFEKVPNFHQSDFTQAPNLANVKVPIISIRRSIFSKLKKEEITKFRALRRLAIDGHDHERERYFFKGEMRNKRGTEEKWWQIWKPSWWFSLLYDAISDYGTAVLRPLALWLLMVPIVAWIYWKTSPIQQAICNTKCQGWDIFWSSINLAVQNTLMFFAVIRKSELQQSYECLFPNGEFPYYIPLIGFAHTFFSAFLLFLILLGLRNMFKIK